MSGVEITTKFSEEDGVSDRKDEITITPTTEKTLYLNQEYQGTIKAGQWYDSNLRYTADTDGPVLFILNSSAEDIDMSIYDHINDALLDSDADGSLEYILLEAVAGKSYSIGIYNESDDEEENDADYTISATQPNRELAKMQDGDYFVSITMQISGTCKWEETWEGESDKDEDTWNEEETFFGVINWEKGHVKQGIEVFNFTSSNQEKLEVSFSAFDKYEDKEIYEGVEISYSANDNRDYTVQLVNTEGDYSKLTGKMKGNSTYSETWANGNKLNDTCEESATLTGEVLF